MRVSFRAAIWHDRCVRYAMVLVLLIACGDRGIGENERAWLLALPPVWTAAAHAERCERPALRTPVTGNGSARLERLGDKSSPQRACLARVREGLRIELLPCQPNQPWLPHTLATIKPHPELVAACAPLYALIEDNAYASEACAETAKWEDEGLADLYAIGNAVRI